MRVSELEREDRWARVAWSHLAEPATDGMVTAVARYGAVGALARLRAGRMEKAGEYAARLAALDLDRARSQVERLQLRVLVPDDDGWPSGVNDLRRPPVCLYVRGDPDLDGLVQGSIAVVGSRVSTAYGDEVAQELAAALALRGRTVVSGAAYGIDVAAHRGALAVGGLTVAVLACGLDRAYPSAHANLLAEIAASAAVVSELPVGTAPFPHRFLARNRLIAALSVGTVVVEAGLRSGSRNTAKHARELLRHVAAAPGPVTSPASAGCHEEIRMGAELVRDADDVLDLMGAFGDDAVGPRREPISPEAELDPVLYAVWSALPLGRPAPLDALCRATGSGPTALLAALGPLVDVHGLAAHENGGWRKVRPRRAQGGR